MITISVKLFGQESICMEGLDHINLEINLDQELTGKFLKERVGEVYPQLAALLPNCRVAVNHEFVDSDQVINYEVDEVALIGMVSGG